MNNDDKILKAIQSLTVDITSMKSDITSMKLDITSMKSDITNMKSDITNIQQTQNLMQTQLHEHSAILGSLQHASEVHKADTDNLVHQISRVSGDLKAFRTESNGCYGQLGERLAGVETDTSYLVDKVARLEKLAK